MSTHDPVAPNFGLTADDYGEYRAGFPVQLIERLVAMDAVRAEDRAVDVGTGTGSLARLLAPHVASVLATDPAEPLLDQGRSHPGTLANITYEKGVAEETGLPDESMDLVTAGQCWHWFDAERAAAELLRVLVPGGRLVIAHFDWLPLPGNVVEATESLILAHNPGWHLGGGTGLYPRWLTDVAAAGFTGIETFSFDLQIPYSHQAWVGRIRASAGVGASLAEDEVERFSAELSELLAVRYPEDPLAIPHRTWAVVSAKPR
jgi:SAM-dependent methyltransferase